MKRITLAERAAQIERRLAAGERLPPAEALRTERKRRLLAKLREVAAAQGREPPFAQETDRTG